MKKFVLTLLLSAFIFVSVHDYVIISIDHNTQSQLYLYESGQLVDVCDVTQKHKALHDALIAIDIVFVPSIAHENNYHDIYNALSFFTDSSPQSIYYPPTV